MAEINLILVGIIVGVTLCLGILKWEARGYFDATKMRPRTPDNEGQGGSRKVEADPQLTAHSALQRATKVKEGH